MTPCFYKARRPAKHGVVEDLTEVAFFMTTFTNIFVFFKRNAKAISLDAVV